MEKIIDKKNNGFVFLILGLLFLFSPLLIIANQSVVMIIVTIVLFVVGFFLLLGLCVIQPNKARVLLFFGKYVGTITNNGFFWLNPFYNRTAVSLRVRNLESDVIKVNDEDGNPILISAVVVWKVVDTYKAVFDIEAPEYRDATTGVNKSSAETAYKDFVKIQTEAALRKIAHSYPYDNLDEHKDRTSLRSGGDVINKDLVSELKDRLEIVGIQIQEARISNLSYAPEIAAVMLQRQQAQALISARKKIVDGAVGMVELALDKIDQKDMVTLSPESKAKLVSNLMMVLCSDQGVTPVVSTDQNI